MSYAAEELRESIVELFDDAARMGRRKEFHVNALTLQRTGEPQPKCLLCGSAGKNHNCPAVVFAPVAIVFPLPPQRHFESKAQKVRAHQTGNCDRCGARAASHRCPG